MLCPACLTFETEADGVATVNGTIYCAHHAVQALAQLQRLGHGQGPARFSDPREAATPA